MRHAEPIDELPPDHYNVMLESHKDRATLLWLVNAIGEAKVCRLARRYQARYPGSQILVSTIVWQYCLREPVGLLAPLLELLGPVTELPPDNFNVIVENETDRARLLWLVNQISEAKVRRTAGKYEARYPGSQIFVSKLLKIYGLKVPVEVYAPVRIPVYWLYLLYKRDRSEVKVGFTGDWPWRVTALVSSNETISEVYDLDRSQAFLIGGNKAEAMRRETVIKEKFAPWRSREKGWQTSYTEWFNEDQFDNLLAVASSFDEPKDLVVQTLGKALELSPSISDRYPILAAKQALQSEG
jgi:hypothetical protein